MKDLIEKLDSEQCIIMALGKDNSQCHVYLNCDEKLPAGLLEMVQCNPETKKSLEDILMILMMVLETDDNDHKEELH